MSHNAIMFTQENGKCCLQIDSHLSTSQYDKTSLLLADARVRRAGGWLSTTKIASI